MLQWVIDEAHGWPGFCRIELECVAWNTNAIGLYESLGYQRAGVIPDYAHRPHGGLVATIVFFKRLARA